MTDERFDISRRALLATGTGTFGFLGLGTLAQARQVSFDRERRIEAQTGPNQPAVDLKVDWKEWYNGRVVERQETTTSRSADAPELVTIPDVDPGDTGKAAFGLSVESDRGNPPPMEIRMRLRELDGARQENGRAEPEVDAGDDTDDIGELQDFLDISLWYDTGVRVGEIPLYGACDMAFNIGDAALTGGTLAEVSVTSESGPWWTLNANPTDPADPGRCLRPNQALCVSLDWSISSEGEDINVIQSDSAGFTVEFAARQCSQ